MLESETAVSSVRSNRPPLGHDAGTSASSGHAATRPARNSIRIYRSAAGYTLQRAQGRDLSSTGSAGQDPNDYTNSYGGLSTRDRPNMLSLMGSYEICRAATIQGRGLVLS